MTRRMAFAVAIAAVLLLVPPAVFAQISLPGTGGSSLPVGGLSKDSLLSEAKNMVSELTSMKSSGKLAPDQAKQVDDLLPKAQSLTSELQKPQVSPTELPKLASNLSDLQKQVGALKGAIK
ncbi:MAG TPA: hypothetical protein VEL75_21020 [Candidatus Methylomirabilis sp.]|nr:hypothetical protein [Candidatus Methylomirabilis sp.]